MIAGITWLLWSLGTDLGLIDVDEQGIQIQAVWQNDITNVVAAHTQVIHVHWILSFGDKLDCLQVHVHGNVDAWRHHGHGMVADKRVLR